MGHKEKHAGLFWDIQASHHKNHYMKEGQFTILPPQNAPQCEELRKVTFGSEIGPTDYT